jgi:hypothetical protein
MFLFDGYSGRHEKNHCMAAQSGLRVRALQRPLRQRRRVFAGCITQVRIQQVISNVRNAGQVTLASIRQNAVLHAHFFGPQSPHQCPR